jgi:asparagine synthase (glutamine-hydrolysing)
MSIIFGIRKPDGEIADESQLMHSAHLTERYAPDGTFVKATGRVGMGFQAYHTHQRSSLGVQPTVDHFGNMLVFDGRLDNHAEICKLLDIYDPHTADSSIALAAFARWGEACFSRFIGDWALAVWSQVDRSLCLARDHAGTRTLYYQYVDSCIRWSTFLETLVGDGRTTDLDEHYIERYLAGRQPGDRTPYKNVRSVPPAHCLTFHHDRAVRKTGCDWMVKGKLRYQTDEEYERHFFALFRQSVERRIGPGAPILAQLSGGMDSSSIVCMSDHIRREQNASSADLVDTISYYDDDEPTWDERPYFTKIEAGRGRAGVHVDNALFRRSWTPFGRLDGTYLFPGMDEGAFRREAALQNRIGASGYRVILSGLGGDELLGGVPTPLPELADSLVSQSWSALCRQSLAWCLVDRSPTFSMLRRTLQLVLNCYLPNDFDQTPPPPWVKVISPWSTDSDTKLLSAKARISLTPSTICGREAWWSILGSLPNSLPDYLVRYEYRFPFLDRDLATFLLQVPREQLVRPGQRRSLMRRALRSVVPPEILQRRRKAYLTRSATIGLRTISQTVSATELRSLRAAQGGFVDPDLLTKALMEVGNGHKPQWIAPLWRTLLFDQWLRNLPMSFARPVSCTPAPQWTRITRVPMWKFNRKQKEAKKCAT